MIDLSKHRDPRFVLPAVRVKSDHPDHEQGFYVINESDFDPEKHELWEEEKPKQQQPSKLEPVREQFQQTKEADAPPRRGPGRPPNALKVVPDEFGS